MSKLTIQNNASASRFEMLVDGQLARLDYRLEDSTIYLLYVEVPDAAQGRGIASQLTEAALKFARDEGRKVVPVCPFIATYVRRHPEMVAAE